MSVGAWEPAKQASNDQSREKIDPTLLTQILELMEGSSAPESSQAQENTELAELPESLRSASWLAGLPAAQWLEEAANWEPEQLWALIRFFTLAEAQLDWQGGAESPVIPLAKSLRRRKAPLSREQLLWIRGNSDNRYLPYGPL
ncbi:hypothetical protein [Microbulbifer agarilyticus]|uniref:hypothetical protein n=1 Tax=Microbulbifer agarilyticus TaxID=260552 RepID=UPI001CD54714|nr:hypothetical protein [Microbulbifer agarilyticus]MCA0894054.1 hypothetical protein [Microbulbifer agarilyticus]